jgi:Flp pilus assembly protein TadB
MDKDFFIYGVPIIVSTVGVICAIILIISLRRFKNQERMKMIEQGMPIQETPTNIATYLTFGFLAIGAGIGLLVAQFLINVWDLGLPVYFASVLIGGGIGLIVSYWVQYRMNKKEREK